MAIIKILHLASFSGNIGDNANHMGFRPWFERQIGRAVKWTSLEIREFYWKERFWDEHFVALANTYDLIVIGGGNYFELWVESSPTGTSIAIDPKLFSKIRVPVYFNALGVDAGQGVSGTSLQRFKSFLDQLLGAPQYLVSVRNDGAVATLEQYLGDDYRQAVHHIPDGGFFAPFAKNSPQVQPFSDKRYIGINIASDMPETRFKRYAVESGHIGFAKEMAKAISLLAETYLDHSFIFFPHIFRDLNIITEVINRLDDRLRRTRLIVASYSTGDNAAERIFGMYGACDLILAMRFHANVCPIGMGVPTLGLNCYRQIASLYTELRQSDRMVDVAQPGFAAILHEKASLVLADPDSVAADLLAAQSQVSTMRIAFEPALMDWAEKNELIA